MEPDRIELDVRRPPAGSGFDGGEPLLSPNGLALDTTGRLHRDRARDVWERLDVHEAPAQETSDAFPHSPGVEVLASPVPAKERENSGGVILDGRVLPHSSHDLRRNHRHAVQELQGLQTSCVLRLLHPQVVNSEARA